MSGEDYDLVIGDIFQTLQSWSGKIDLIIADPPFNIQFDKSSHEYGASQYKLYSDDMTGDDYQTFSKGWIDLCYGALADEGSMYIGSGWTNLVHILSHIIWRYTCGVYTQRRFVTSH